ncbi:MAG: DUF3368 domain-containing protein [Chloroflexi bacterium]|nr:DUF3368 domain-containing protein [Chloroflexota bacterium]
MPVGPVILNNTPLVALWLLDQFPLLQTLFGQVIIPTAVHAEFLAIEQAARQQALAASPWIKTTEIFDPRLAQVYLGLDRGESEVLALALERSARLVIMDERQGRRYAQRLALPLTGTLGVLLLAKEKQLITAVSPLIEQLQASNLFFDLELIHHVLQLAGE